MQGPLNRVKCSGLLETHECSYVICNEFEPVI